MKSDPFKLYLFSPKIHARNKMGTFHNLVYDLWEDVWTKEFSKIGSDLKPDHFLRQDIIPVIAHGDEIVSMHLYTFFNLFSNSTIKNPYFRGFKNESVEYLRENGMHTVMGMEYLTVNPKWRKSISGIPFGEVMVGIATKIMGENSIDACIGTARTDIGIDKVAKKFGASIIEANINRYNLETALISIPKEKFLRHPEKEVADLIDRLWHARTDCRNFFDFSPALEKAA